MNTDEFAGLLAKYSQIKEKHVTPRLKFYMDRVDNKRRLAQWSRALILLLSLAIPVVAHLKPLHDNSALVVSIMSLLIALGSGLEGLHQWQLTWKQYSLRIVQIDDLIALWKVQVARASELSDVKDASEALAKATENLLQSVESVVLTEAETFFSERTKAQQPQNSDS